MKYKLNICHLYADYMNTYGDDGNIICLENRCGWRGIEAKVTQISIGDKINHDKFDLYFFGGGQDQQQIAVSGNLQKINGKLLKKAVANGAVVFAVCGGYQLLGHYYQPQDAKQLFGVGLLDVITVAGNRRMIGNIVIELNQELLKKELPHNNQDRISKVIGFENHSGQTFLGNKVQPLGRVITGFGNNGRDKTEGAWQGNVFGCYLHGSVLPKNPHFADFLIEKALERRHGKVELEPIDDSLEWQTHQSLLRKFT